MTITFILIGLMTGVLSGVFGIGGGIIIVPSLIFFAKMSQKTAVGTSLGSLLLPVGLLGVWTYYKDGHVNEQYRLWIVLMFQAWLQEQRGAAAEPLMAAVA